MVKAPLNWDSQGLSSNSSIVPVPYPNSRPSSNQQQSSSKVKVSSKDPYAASEIALSSGDESGAQGGLFSSSNGDESGSGIGVVSAKNFGPWEIEFLATKVFDKLKDKLAVEKERQGRPDFPL